MDYDVYDHIGNFTQENAWCTNSRARHLAQRDQQARRTNILQMIRNHLHSLFPSLLPNTFYLRSEEIAPIHKQLTIDTATMAISMLPTGDVAEVVRAIRTDYPKLYHAMRETIATEDRVTTERAIALAKAALPMIVPTEEPALV